MTGSGRAGHFQFINVTGLHKWDMKISAKFQPWQILSIANMVIVCGLLPHSKETLHANFPKLSEPLRFLSMPLSQVIL